ncbi:MAG: 3-dehydroquinate synthase [Lachnospiraceae bacterium]|nr:3-dehydroquinate synthase [Lachnospiraceae bacterium]
MERILVYASTDYEVIIGTDLLDHAGEYIAEAIAGKNAAHQLDNKTAVIVSDDNVFPLYGDRLKKSLQATGLKTLSFVFPHGEKSKSLATFGELLEFMCESKVKRSDMIVALGGGVVGDLSGFAAASYQRGIDFIQVPTSLLAAVDSSVGGKTAVDLKSGKNQVGAFYQPRLVLCDIDTLKTLPKEEYECGCGEIIKYAILESDEFFDELMEKPVSEQYEHVIATCVNIKKHYVENDEFDKGLRMKLNLGHTFGHAVETCSEYTILHGQAVAMGMAAVTRAASEMGLCSKETVTKVLELLDRYELPKDISFRLDEMYEAMLVDKKNSGTVTNLIVPTAIGNCRIMKIPTDKLKGWLEEGGVER